MCCFLSLDVPNSIFIFVFNCIVNVELYIGLIDETKIDTPKNV